MRVMLYDPSQIFTASIQPQLGRRGHTVVHARSPHDVIGATDIDGSLVALDSIARPRQLRDTHRPMFLITDREDSTVLKDALGAQSAGIASTLNRADDIIDAAVTSFGGNQYFDPQLLHAALGPRPVLGTSAAHTLAGHLTPREDDVLKRIVHGEATVSMAHSMGVSVSTVRSHIQNVLGKLGVQSRLGAIAFALNYGLVNPSEKYPMLG